jgi:outer membrane protein TolC
MRYTSKSKARWRVALAGLVAAVSAAAPVGAGSPARADEAVTQAGAQPAAVSAPVAARESAGEALPPADLGALLREAQESSPAIRAAAARLEAAGRIPSQAGALPDPEASVGYTNDGVSGFTLGDREFSTLRLTWTQEVPYPGKRRRAAEVATFGAERTGRDLERTRLEVASAVKSAYAELYRLDRTAVVLAENRSVLESFVQVARRRYEVGEGAQENILKAQTEVLRLEAEIARVAQDRRAAELRLNAAVGRAADVGIGPATALPEAALPSDRAALSEAAAAASPEVGALQAAVRQGEAGLRLSRLNLKPDFLWSAAYDYRGDLDPMVTGMFGLRLPAYRQRKQVQAVAQAESELTAAQRDLEDRQVRIRAEVGEMISRIERAERLLMLFGQGIIPQARRTLESARASYGVGKVDMLDLLTDLTAVLGSEIEYASQEAERFQSLAALEPLLGREMIQARAEPDGAGGSPGARRSPADGVAGGGGSAGGSHE